MNKKRVTKGKIFTLRRGSAEEEGWREEFHAEAQMARSPYLLFPIQPAHCRQPWPTSLAQVALLLLILLRFLVLQRTESLIHTATPCVLLLYQPPQSSLCQLPQSSLCQTSQLTMCQLPQLSLCQPPQLTMCQTPQLNMSLIPE